MSSETSQQGAMNKEVQEVLAQLKPGDYVYYRAKYNKGIACTVARIHAVDEQYLYVTDWMESNYDDQHFGRVNWLDRNGAKDCIKNLLELTVLSYTKYKVLVHIYQNTKEDEEN